MTVTGQLILILDADPASKIKPTDEDRSVRYCKVSEYKKEDGLKYGTVVIQYLGNASIAIDVGHVKSDTIADIYKGCVYVGQLNNAGKEKVHRELESVMK